MMKPYENSKVITWCGWLTDSFNALGLEQKLHVGLKGQDLARTLYEDGRVILSHEYLDIPRFCFANAKAQEQFGYNWNEFQGMDSRLSAQADDVAAREELLKRAAEEGYIDNYEGVRIRKDKTKFHVTDVILWNVLNEREKVVGQAAIFSSTP